MTVLIQFLQNLNLEMLRDHTQFLRTKIVPQTETKASTHRGNFLAIHLVATQLPFTSLSRTNAGSKGLGLGGLAEFLACASVMRNPGGNVSRLIKVPHTLPSEASHGRQRPTALLSSPLGEALAMEISHEERCCAAAAVCVKRDGGGVQTAVHPPSLSFLWRRWLTTCLYALAGGTSFV